MAQFERYEPRGDKGRVFDGGEMQDDEEEGSRLPLLLVIGLLVVAAFGGVVWLAYTQGVQRGRADAPRLLVAAGTDTGPSRDGTKGLKVYQQPAPPQDEDSDATPQPPTPVKAAAAPLPEAAPAKPANPAPVPANHMRMAQASAADNPPPAAVSAPPTAPQEATKPPRALVTSHPAPLQAPRAQPLLRTPASAKAAAAPQPHPRPQAAPQPQAAAAATVPAASLSAASSAAAGGVLLQIGAYKSEAEANAAWNSFRRKHAMAGSYQPNIKKVDLADKGVWYRLRLGPFADKSAASAFCDKLKADGGTCFPAR